MTPLVLLSGGLDSCVSLAWAQDKFGSGTAVNFHYGQSHSKEIEAARRIANHYSWRFESHRLNFTHLVPAEVGHLLKGANFDPIAARQTVKDVHGNDVSATFVPGRNIIFLAYAGSMADMYGHEDIVIGVNAVDYSGYPDCRPQFIQWMTTALSTGLRYPVKIHAPLIGHTKAQIIRAGINLGAPLNLTWSCYDGRAFPCGECPSCLIRIAGFADVGIDDPALT